jgi:hypothetical protein
LTACVREWLDDYMIAWMGVVAVYTLCVHDMNDGLLCSLCMSDVCVCVCADYGRSGKYAPHVQAVASGARVAKIKVRSSAYMRVQYLTYMCVCVCVLTHSQEGEW